MNLIERVRLLAEHGLSLGQIAAVLGEDEGLIAEIYSQAVHARTFERYRPWELAIIRVLGGDVPLAVVAQALARTPEAVRRARPGQKRKGQGLCPFCGELLEPTMPPVAAASESWGRIERCLYCAHCDELFLVRHEWENLKPPPENV